MVHFSVEPSLSSLNLIWYGSFKPSQRAIVTDFLTSLSSPSQSQPSVSTWWKATEKYYSLAHTKSSNSNKKPLLLTLGKHILDENYSLGKSLSSKQIQMLAAMGEKIYAINIVLTASDVAVEGFCMSRCGTHGASPKVAKEEGRFAYIWVGNSETQCPGQCAWPFHQPIYGPQTPPLVAPNNDVGLDGMVINIASLLAGTVTNPFEMGSSRGPRTRRLRLHRLVLGCMGRGRTRVTQASCWLIRARVRVTMRMGRMGGSICCLP